MQSIKHQSQEEVFLLGMLELRRISRKIGVKNRLVLSDCLLYPRDSKHDLKIDHA